MLSFILIGKKLDIIISYNFVSFFFSVGVSNITTDKQKYTPDNQYKFLIILTIMNNLLFLLNKLKENIKYKTDKYNIKIQYIQPNSITNKGKTKNFGIKSSVIPRGGTKKLIKKPTKN